MEWAKGKEGRRVVFSQSSQHHAGQPMSAGAGYAQGIGTEYMVGAEIFPYAADPENTLAKIPGVDRKGCCIDRSGGGPCDYSKWAGRTFRQDLGNGPQYADLIGGACATPR